MKEERKKELLEILQKEYFKNNKFLSRKLKTNDKLKNELISFTSFLPEDVTLSQRYHTLFLGINNNPTCKNPECTKEVSFLRTGYRDFCSADCSYKFKNLSFKEKLDIILKLNPIIKPLTTYEVKEIINSYYLIKEKNKLSSGKVQVIGVKKETYNLFYSLYYHTQFLDIESSFAERIYCIMKDIKKIPLCKICNNKLKFNNKYTEGYGIFCSQKCIGIGTLDKVKKTNLKKYGVENVFQAEIIKNKIKKTNLEKYGVENPSQNENIKEKKSQTSLKNYGKNYYSQTEERKRRVIKTNLEKYGVENPSQVEEFKEKAKKTNLEKYGTESPIQNKEIKEKIKKTNLEKYGSECILTSEYYKQKVLEYSQKNYGVYHFLQSKDIIEKREKTNLEKYGVENVFSNSNIQEKIKQTNLQKYDTENPLKNKDIQEKSKKTNLKKYGVEYIFQNKEFIKKSHITKKKNGTYGKSKEEDLLYEYLINEFPFIERQYKLGNTHYFSDFYIHSHHLYVEYQGYFSHGKEAFRVSNKEHMEIVNKWKQKNTKHYDNAITQWTIRDPKKRQIAKDNNLKYLEIYKFDKNKPEDIFIQIFRIIYGLNISFSHNYLHKEFNRIKKSNKNGYKTSCQYNSIILQFQKHFYEKENKKYKEDPFIRRKLIENRIKYLNKSESELTDRDLLTGFKKSRIHYGYSFFSPFWIKQFIDDYNIKSIYDPCGGWGHRLLGAYNIKYIYNDYNSKSCEGIKNIIKFFNLKDKFVYNNDSSKLKIEDKYEAVFTCPPYFDTENYGYKNSCENIYKNDYNLWLNKWWYNTVKNSSKNGKVNYFAYVISYKFKEDMNKIIEKFNYKKLKEIPLGPEYKDYMNKDSNKKVKEFLVIFIQDQDT